MYKEQQWYRGAIVGAIITLGTWKSYLILRNTRKLRSMPDAPPELEISPVTYDKMQQMTQYDSDRFLLITVIEVNVRLAKLAFNYFPYIWNLSEGYGSTLVSRAMWFTAIDNCATVLVDTPIAVLNSLLSGENPFLSIINQIIEVAFRSLLAAGATYVVIYVVNNYGVSSILKVQLAINAIGLLCMAFYLRFMMSLDHERLPDNEIGRTVNALAKDVGYPSETIYLNKRSPEPNAYYSSAILSKVIIINESLIMTLDAPQVASVVAHELGHWKYHHPLYTFLGHTLEIVAMGCFWICAYGSLTLTGVYQLDPEVHPFIPVYLSLYFIWPPCKDLIQGIFNLIKTHFEYVADDYACNVWSARNLRTALTRVATKTKSFPLLDNWFAAWFIGHPSILQRIRRIDVLTDE